MQVVEDVTGSTLQQVVDETVAPGSKIECDGYKSYRNLSGVAQDAKKYETGYLHWLHKAISNLKAFLLGTYHGRCTQPQSYLDEFCFRFNRRKPAIRSSCAWQETSLHLVHSCVKPISKFQKSKRKILEYERIILVSQPHNNTQPFFLPALRRPYP